MVSQTIMYKNDITGETFETKLEAVDSEFGARHVASMQRGMFADRTKVW